MIDYLKIVGFHWVAILLTPGVCVVFKMKFVAHHLQMV